MAPSRALCNGEPPAEGKPRFREIFPLDGRTKHDSDGRTKHDSLQRGDTGRRLQGCFDKKLRKARWPSCLRRSCFEAQERMCNIKVWRGPCTALAQTSRHMWLPGTSSGYHQRTAVGDAVTPGKVSFKEDCAWVAVGTNPPPIRLTWWVADLNGGARTGK